MGGRPRAKGRDRVSRGALTAGQLGGLVLGGVGRLKSCELWPAQASTGYQRPR